MFHAVLAVEVPIISVSHAHQQQFLKEMIIHRLPIVVLVKMVLCTVVFKSVRHAIIAVKLVRELQPISVSLVHLDLIELLIMVLAFLMKVSMMILSIIYALHAIIPAKLAMVLVTFNV
jgi:hypothetical protein